MRTATLAYHPAAKERQHQLHARLNRFNSARLMPAHTRPGWQAELRTEYEMRVEEGHFIEAERQRVQATAQQAPEEAGAFLRWFEELRHSGPGQGDPLFAWLAGAATLPEMRWFLTQEAAGEAGFDDLVALTQVRFPARAKLEMARNYWDEMGRGHEQGMHGLMLAVTVRELGLEPCVEETVWESLALSNLMAGLASNRRFAYQAIGALGVIEMTAPGRVKQVDAGLERLGVPIAARTYFKLHASLDQKHSAAWNAEVLVPLVQADPRVAAAIAEGALMRLSSGARCFRRYRAQFGLD